MKILAVEVTGNACSVALCDGEKCTQKTIEAPQKQGALLLPMIEELLTEMNLTGQDLDVIAFDCGPGSFTGVRLTVAVAQGLGFGWNKLLMPVSSLQALAYKTYLQNPENPLPIEIAIDARKQEVYAGGYSFVNGQIKILIQEQVIAPELLSFSTISLSLSPEAIDILRLAQFFLKNGQNPILPENAQPVYLRNKVTD